MMKKLLVAVSFIVAPLFSGAALAGNCQHGEYARVQADNDELLIAKESDSELLELLRKQREQEALESQVVTYN